jgi:hypothetical protein
MPVWEAVKSAFKSRVNGAVVFRGPVAAHAPEEVFRAVIIATRARLVLVDNRKDVGDNLVKACATTTHSALFVISHFPNLAPSPARRGKKKRAFDAFRLWHRQAPREEGKPKARHWARLVSTLLPVLNLAVFRTEEILQ